jgi:hypothetical protein
MNIFLLLFCSEVSLMIPYYEETEGLNLPHSVKTLSDLLEFKGDRVSKNLANYKSFNSRPRMP